MKGTGSTVGRILRLSPRQSLRHAVEQSVELAREGEALLGTRQWTLLSSYGRLMAGPHAGSYFNALPVQTQRDMLSKLVAGEEIAVHLMHRHRSGHYEASSLRYENSELWMVFAAGRVKP